MSMKELQSEAAVPIFKLSNFILVRRIADQLIKALR